MSKRSVLQRHAILQMGGRKVASKTQASIYNGVSKEQAKVFATNLFPTRGKNTAKKIANLAASF
jgi:hypothetical protein